MNHNKLVHFFSIFSKNHDISVIFFRSLVTDLPQSKILSFPIITIRKGFHHLFQKLKSAFSWSYTGGQENFWLNKKNYVVIFGKILGKLIEFFFVLEFFIIRKHKSVVQNSLVICGLGDLFFDIILFFIFLTFSLFLFFLFFHLVLLDHSQLESFCLTGNLAYINIFIGFSRPVGFFLSFVFSRKSFIRFDWVRFHGFYLYQLLAH